LPKGPEAQLPWWLIGLAIVNQKNSSATGGKIPTKQTILKEFL